MKPQATIAAFAALLGLAFAPPPAGAVDTIYSEQGKLIRAGEAVGTLGADLFGDKVNLYTGTVEFIQNDVSLPGNNNLPVSVGRRLVTGGESITNRGDRAFGDWELEIPHMHGVYAESTGWQTLNGGNLRCSGYSEARTVSGSGGGSTWSGNEYWHGHFMYVPGAGSQELLARATDNPNYPNFPTDSAIWPLVTKNLWAIGCIQTMKRGPGEGFLAISPDGTKYRFDWMVSRPYQVATKSSRLPEASLVAGGSSITDSLAQAPGIDESSNQTMATPGGPLPNLVVGGLLKRVEVWIMPSRVTDRFGNYVDYNYSGTEPWKLQSIVASDGRTISFNYLAGTQRIASVYDGNRTWNYTYHSNAVGAMLDRVTLPDNSFWQFNADKLSAGLALYRGPPRCEEEGSVDSTPTTGTMTHPSGAQGSFTITGTSHSKSFVPRLCLFDLFSDASAIYPRYFAHKSLTNKTISGPGLPSMAWNYTYSPAAGSASWSTCTGTCPETKSVSVSDPRGYVTRYTFGNRHNATEGQLQKVEAGWNGSTALRTTSTRFRDPAAGPYPSYAGGSPQWRGNGDFASRYTPEDQRVITQQGVNFTWEGSGFDVKARPTIAARSSSLGSRTETTVFADNTVKWVLGQIGSVTEASVNPGTVMVANVYHPSTATLTNTSKFGRLDQSFTYYPDGTLWTRKDGLNQTTTFSNYKRGLAQNATYADGATESAVVDNMGLIRSVTDANGFTTTYEYEDSLGRPVGRLSKIIRPTGDTVQWNNTTLIFEPVTSDEYGLGLGHWRQTIKTGDARTINYFDALWRPRVTSTFELNREASTAKTVLRNFDADNRKVFESYPARTIGSITATPNGSSTVYDAIGRPINTFADSELGSLKTTTDYLDGFRKQFTNQRNFVTTTSYQAFDEPSESAITTIFAPESLRVDISRDVFGKPRSITRSGTTGGTVSATRNYVYDANQRLCKTVEPEIGATIQDYDAANNITWRATGLSLTSLICDRGSVPLPSQVKYAYDLRNRLKGTGFGDGSAAIGRDYTPDGLVSAVVSGTSTWTYAYNKRRLLEQETLSNGSSYVIKRGYNPNGHVSQLTYPDGAVVSYAPNALGEATQVSGYTQANTVSYHPNGGVDGYTLANGTVHKQTQNVRGLPWQNKDNGVMDDTYTYDQNANVTGIADQVQSLNRSMPDYDGLDRLRTANSPGVWGTASYTYDALDNIRTSVVGSRNSIHIYNPSTNLLDTINTNGVYTGFVYDTQGNITGRGSKGYYFDQGNRMQLANGIASYTYDGWGRRTTIADASGNRVQVYDQAGQLLYGTRQQGATTVATRYVYLGGKAIAETDNAIGTTYLFTDALGSPVARVGTVPAAVGYTCPAGWVLSGTTCSQGTTSTTPATLAGYTCPAGYTLSGSTCSLAIGTTTAATLSYSCPAGWSLAGSTCTTSTSSPATPVYTCPAGFTLSGTTCTGTATTAATSTLNCNGQGTLTAYAGSTSGYMCTTQNLLVSNYPPPGDPVEQCQIIAASKGLPLVATPLINNGKIVQCVMGPLRVYSCPPGGTLSGSTCTRTVTQAASIGSYACASGTLSGSSCISNSSAAATAYYSCPAGTSLSGTNCNGSSTVSTPGTAYYSCPAGATLSGSSCTTQGTATSTATAGWACPNGGTLSGISCLGAMLRTRYEAYGNTAAGTIPNGIGFTGHVNDADTGLVYMQQRYYDPVAGRFLSVDPVVTDADTGKSFGRYHYANNNPFRYTDPDGQDPPPNLEFCQSATGTNCGWGDSSSGRATTVKAGMAVGGVVATAFATGCTIGSGGVCVLGGPAIVAGGIATGAVVANTAFDLFEWMKGLVYSSAEADSDKEPAASDRGSRRPNKEVKDAADAAARDKNGNLNCQYCGQGLTEEPGRGNSREFDHRHPWSRGGGSGKNNVVDACRDCNRGPGGKGSKLFPDEWVPPPRP